MKSLGTIFAFEFTRIIRKPSFWLITLAFPTLIAAILALSVFSNQTSQTADQNLRQEKFSFAVMDDSKLLQANILTSTEAKTVTDKSVGIERVKRGEIDAFFYYPAEPAQQDIEIFAKDDSLVKNDKYSATAVALLQSSLVAAINSPQTIQLLQHEPRTTLKTYQDGQETKGFGRVIIPGLFLILFYAVVVLLGNQMLVSTTEEKENRVIEMILTSVRAQTLIIGKFLALTALGLIQIGAILAPLVIAYFGFRTQLHIPNIDLAQISFAPLPIIIGALIFVAGFLLFSALLIAIGSAVPTAKEANNFFGLVILVMFVPFYALSAVVTSPDQLIVKGLTYFPLTAPITLMLRNAVGNLTPIEVLIGLAILVASAGLAMRLAIRTFGYGTLEYNRRLSLRELFTRRS